MSWMLSCSLEAQLHADWRTPAKQNETKHGGVRLGFVDAWGMALFGVWVWLNESEKDLNGPRVLVTGLHGIAIQVSFGVPNRKHMKTLEWQDEQFHCPGLDAVAGSLYFFGFASR